MSKVLIIDNGNFVELAILLAKKHKVGYFCEYTDMGFPPANYYYIGRGFDEFERVYDIWEFLKDTTHVLFTDVYHGNLATELRRQGKKVYSSFYGEEMELDRVMMKELLTELGMDVGKYKVVKGIKALREYLKEHENIWVKVSRLRGLTESFKSPNYKLIEPYIDSLQQDLSPLSEEIDFICEDDLPDMVEVGMDTWCVNGRFPNITGGGIEIKDLGYISICQAYDKFPKQLTEINEKLSKKASEVGYNGAFATEVRIDKTHNYLMDFTARFPCPDSFLQMYQYKNFDDIILGTAEGRIVDAEPIMPIGAEIIILSSWAEKHFQPIYIPDEIREQVKLKNLTKVNGNLYVIPCTTGLVEIGSCVACGNTVEEAIENVKKVAEKIEGIKIEFNMDAFNKVEEQIEKLDKLGINFFKGEPLKEPEPKEEPKPEPLTPNS